MGVQVCEAALGAEPARQGGLSPHVPRPPPPRREELASWWPTRPLEHRAPAAHRSLGAAHRRHGTLAAAAGANRRQRARGHLVRQRRPGPALCAARLACARPHLQPIPRHLQPIPCAGACPAASFEHCHYRPPHRMTSAALDRRRCPAARAGAAALRPLARTLCGCAPCDDAVRRRVRQLPPAVGAPLGGRDLQRHRWLGQRPRRPAHSGGRRVG